MESFLEKLYNQEAKLSFLLLEAKQIADNYEDYELSSYIDKEINGYKSDDDLPDYRRIKGQILADIKNVYGDVIQTEHPLDFSIASKEVGFDLASIKLFDGLSFIENSLTSLTGTYALREMPVQAVKMLDDVFHYNNNQLHLMAAYHRIPTPLIAYIPIIVRQNLIQHFQNLQKKIQREKISSSNENVDIVLPAHKQRRVFVSYAWESDAHNSNIVSFVDFLRINGFDAFMDKKVSQEETSVNFNQLMIEGIKDSDKVIVVLSKKYKAKADKFEGGVWRELNIIVEDMKNKKNKYIFVHFGNDDRIEITPTAILAIDVLDLKKDQDENEFNTLFAKIKEENIINFSNVNSAEVEIKKTIIKPFRL